MFILVILLSVAGTTFADEPSRSPAQAVEVVDDTKAAIPTDKVADPPNAPDGHKYWLVSAVLSPVDWWIPGKYGVQFAYMPTNQQSFEFEYLRGSFGSGFLGNDLGEVLEQRVTVQSRYFLTDTLNYHAGLHYNYFEVQLKDKYTSNVPVNPDDEDYGLVELATVGITLGVGNRWQFDNGMEVGVDWVQLQMPLIRLQQNSPILDLSADAESRDQVSEALRRMRDNPRFALLKIQAGISF
jgi:hypothetical protein